MNDPWLARPTTIRLLWRVFVGALVLVALADLVIDLHGYFGARNPVQAAGQLLP
jgi:hypothetical protein